MKNRIIYLLLLLLTFVANAQEKDKVLPEANEEYAEKKFADAEANYRISHSKFPNRTVSTYNLGNSIYRQNQFSESKFAYMNALKNLKTRSQKHKAFHNLGNVFMKRRIIPKQWKHIKMPCEIIQRMMKRAIIMRMPKKC